MPRWTGFFLAILALVAGGCSHLSQPAQDPGDPFEASNRQVFAFNVALDRMFMQRTARFYNRTVPQSARDGIHNVLENLDLPVTFANDVLQGEAERAAQTFARFSINSTLGLGGIFDPAAVHFQIAAHREDFGQTLGVWGVGNNPYVMLPLLGPSSPRDAAGRVGDILADPMTWLTFKQHIWWQGGRAYMELLDLRARNIETLDDIERSSVDPYASARSLYRQYRENEINNGKPSKADLPDL
ncbi:MAG: VacJ family lipoprotein [Alphaproteobacteria bacterium]|nr:VacJ family lipoprotein [Alphaproteobacteria bacterium]